MSPRADAPLRSLSLLPVQRRNAVDRSTAAALASAFADFEEDGELRVALLLGSEDCFCASVVLFFLPFTSHHTHTRALSLLSFFFCSSSSFSSLSLCRVLTAARTCKPWPRENPIAFLPMDPHPWFPSPLPLAKTPTHTRTVFFPLLPSSSLDSSTSVFLCLLLSPIAGRECPAWS